MNLKKIAIQYRSIGTATDIFQKYHFCKGCYELVLYTKVSLKIYGDKPRRILNISIINNWHNFVIYLNRVVLFSTS